MKPYSNYHSHSLYCDGRNSPEEMVLEAISLGCAAIGFSGHSSIPFDPGYCMDEGREEAYIREVRRLQKAYAGKIQIYLGIEQDYYSAPARQDYQYIIGSVHYIKKDGEFVSIDDTPEKLKDAVDRLYGGDFYSLCRDYYALVGDVVNRTHCQVVGHFDLITKFSEKYPFLDQNDPRYRQPALSALRSLLSQKALLECNTGAVSRGWRTQAYPADFLLEEMGRQGAEILLSSDAHRKEDLLFGLEQAERRCRSYGIRVING